MVAPVLLAGARMAALRGRGKALERGAVRLGTNIRGRVRARDAQTQGAPRQTMPGTRAVVMVTTALVLDFIQMVFSLAFIFFPLIVGVAAGGLVGGAVTEKCEGVFGANDFCSFVGSVVGGYAGTTAAAGAVAADVFSGGGITAAGNVLASIVGLVGFLVFYLWFAFSGVKFFGSARSTKRFAMRLVQGVCDSLPFIAVLPWMTISVGVICLQAMREDREKRAEHLAQVAEQQRMEQARLVAIEDVRTRETIQNQQQLLEMEQAQEEAQENETNTVPFRRPSVSAASRPSGREQAKMVPFPQSRPAFSTQEENGYGEQVA